MSKSIPKMFGSGYLKIFDAEIECFVLVDGTPLIGKTKVLEALGRPKKGDGIDGRVEFLRGNNVQPFITDELNQKLEGVEFMNGNKRVSAYHADILPLICNVYLEAREANVLRASQLAIAQRCEVLMRSFAKVGLTALIYELVGFEKYKHPEALRQLIESYLSEEIRRWSKEFPDELFRQMDRIYGNEKTTSRNRPLYYANFIRKYIYDPIERGLVLKQLDEKNPRTEKGYRKHHHHRILSEEVGLPAIRSQIWQVIATLKISSDKRRYESNFARMMGQTYQAEIWEDISQAN